MTNKNRKTRAVHGVTTPPVRPTVLGAALVAGAVSLPVGITIQLISLLVL